MRVFFLYMWVGLIWALIGQAMLWWKLRHNVGETKSIFASLGDMHDQPWKIFFVFNMLLWPIMLFAFIASLFGWSIVK